MLTNALENYKNKKYQFGYFETEEDVKGAYLNKKIFVLKGGFGNYSYIDLMGFSGLSFFFLVLA